MKFFKLIFLWLKWFLIPDGIIVYNRYATQEQKMRHIAIQEKMAGHPGVRGQCKVCGQKYVTTKKDPVCDKWSCRRTYNGL